MEGLSMPGKPLRVLVIDDQIELLGVLRSTLEADGHETLTAASGAEGLALAEQHLPDIILLDINMPDMGGLDVLQVLRQSQVTARIPVILLTGGRDHNVMRRGFELGADDYVQKPFNVAELRARVRHQTRLKLANDEIQHLQELNRLKEDFIAVLSHELRTPLTAIIGFTELVCNGTAGPLTQEQGDFLHIVIQRAGDLHHLIEELLEFNLLKAGQRWINPSPVPLRELVASATTQFQPALQSGELSMALDLPPSDCVALVDAELIKRVLTILLSNAVKFTEPGGTITLEASAGESQIDCRVRDTGIGIPRDSLPVIFDSFRQMEGHSTRRYGGLGLGLSIAKHLVELHGGRIWAESEEGKGSTFAFRVPCHPQQQDAAAAEPAQERRSSDLHRRS